MLSHLYEIYNLKELKGPLLPNDGTTIVVILSFSAYLSLISWVLEIFSSKGSDGHHNWQFV